MVAWVSSLSVKQRRRDVSDGWELARVLVKAGCDSCWQGAMTAGMRRLRCVHPNRTSWEGRG